MSTETFDSTVEFLPQTRKGRSGKSPSIILAILQAINEGREAEATYRREIARGTTPAKAAAKAFAGARYK